MATTPTTRVTDLARRYRLDVDMGTYPTVNYQQLIGIAAAKLIEELRTVDDETYDDSGAMREEVTGYQWRIEGRLKNSLNAAGTSRNAVHAFLRAKFDALKAPGAHAAQNEFGVRWYDRNGIAGEAYEGRVYVKVWSTNDDKGASDEITFTLFGQGPISAITNPASSQVPVITSLSPTTVGAAGGELLHIYGHHFTGATAVEFDGTPTATDWSVVDDGHIVVVTPADSGTVAVTVVTPEGESAPANLTYA